MHELFLFISLWLVTLIPDKLTDYGSNLRTFYFYFFLVS